MAERIRRYNAALLVGAFALGQGALFLSQTMLVGSGNLELLAAFGTHFSIAVLALLFVEAGSLTILSRKTAMVMLDNQPQGAIWKSYWDISVFRIGLSALAITGATVWHFVSPDAFGANYALFASPGLAVWAFSGGGILDGARLAGVTGLAGIFPYVLSAIALAVFSGNTNDQAGMLTGLALTIGCIMTVMSQFIALYLLGIRPTFVQPTIVGIKNSARDGTSMLLGILPGQIFFRAQIVICSIFLGAGVTALFIYSKQVTNAIAQTIGFIRRIEFPGLVITMRTQSTPNALAILLHQRKGTVLAVVSALALVSGSIAFLPVAPENFQEACLFVALFAPLIAIAEIYVALRQGLNAVGRYAVSAATVNLSVLSGVALTLWFVPHIGIVGIAVAEVLTQIIGITLVSIYLKRGWRP